MKIALINKFYPPMIGGIEYHVRDLAINLENYSDVEKIEILVANTGNVLKTERLSSKIFLTRLPNLKTISSTPIAPSFVKTFNSVDVDLFHFHFPYPFGDLAWILSNNKKPFIITYHSDIVRQKCLNFLYKPIRNYFFSKAENIIATSPNILTYSDVLSKYVEKSVVIPLGINLDKYSSQETIVLGEQIKRNFSDKLLILFVGRFVYYKGVEVLLESIKSIDAYLFMIGNGPLLVNLKSTVKKYNIEKNVFFYTDVSDDVLPAFFRACDVFVLPSIANTEAYGLVQLEAQACGKPVISTNLPTGVPFINKHNETGLVVPPGDISALTKAIILLQKNKELREKLGNQARKRVREGFTDKRMTEKVYSLYRKVLK